MKWFWLSLLQILGTLLQGVSMLRLVDLKIPSYHIRGQPVRLECHYDLEGEALYSFKFFKDQREFYRFLPGDDPPVQILNLTGVSNHVDLATSSDNVVTLRSVDHLGTGVYRCEVSGEAPSFQTVGQSAHMFVVDLPDSGGPQIEGTRPRYSMGETLHINCTSSRSRPAAKLMWFVNQEQAEDDWIIRYPIFKDEDGFETAVLGLEFKVRPKHFLKGALKIKCLATIASLYWRSNEESVQGIRPNSYRLSQIENKDSTDYDFGDFPTDSAILTSPTNNPLSFLLIVLVLIWRRWAIR